MCTLSWRLVYNSLLGLNFLAVPLSELISDQFAWDMIPRPCGTCVFLRKKFQVGFIFLVVISDKNNLSHMFIIDHHSHSMTTQPGCRVSRSSSACSGFVVRQHTGSCLIRVPCVKNNGCVPPAMYV